MARKDSSKESDDDDRRRLLQSADDEETSIENKWKTLPSFVLKLILTGTFIFSAVAALILFLGSTNKTQLGLSQRSADANFPYSKIRLPGDVIPEKYYIHLHPNLTTFDVYGDVKIFIICKQNTDRIVLHSADNKISHVAAFKDHYLIHDEKNGKIKPITIVRILESKTLQLLYLKLGSSLMKGGKYTLVLKFHGHLNDKTSGFYRSYYYTAAGEKRYIASTQFEPTDARRAFPCFDEPGMKATFQITIIRQEKMIALSNMPVSHSTSRSDGLIVDHFAESVKMSTYLVAFVICDFGHKEAKTKSGVQVRVWAPTNVIHQVDFALYAAVKTLNFYEAFFRLPFPLPKQDLIAVPDLSPGAMENWGLIVYREVALLYDEKESSNGDKQDVAVSIAHELAHQWFGNLVTMKWWNDLWLNEGFASYMEFIGTSHLKPTWKMMDQFQIQDTQTALSLDSLANSHPISVEVKDPNQINEIFDYISYNKGASIIRMLRNFLGHEKFHAGLKAYLQKYQYKNAETDNLWESLSKVSGINVKDVMDTWTLQMGYPVITIKRDQKNINQAIAEQHRFLLEPTSDQKQSKFNYKWEVPLTYRTEIESKSMKSKIHWMHKNEDKISLSWPQSSGWIKGNVNGIGFYRCNYEESNWRALIQQLQQNHKKIRTADRANLIDDAFELARANLISQTIALDLTRYMHKEHSYSPWSTAISSLEQIGHILEKRQGYKYYKEYTVLLLKPITELLGWKDTGTHLQKFLRGRVFYTSVDLGYDKAVQEAKKMFDDYMSRNLYIPPNLRSTIYLAGIKYGSKKEWDFLWEKYNNASVAGEKIALLMALGNTRDEYLIKRYLKWSLDISKIQSQDALSVIESIASTIDGLELAWEFVKANWNTIYKRFSGSSDDVGALLKSTAGQFVTKEKLNELEEFVKVHKLVPAMRSAQQAIENIKFHISWLAREEMSVTDWFKKHSLQIM